MTKHRLYQLSAGYTLVELMVALAVSAIVIGGTYAGYSFFSRQQQVMTATTDLDRNALRAIDWIKSDIRLAGYKDYGSSYAMTPSQVIVIASPSDLQVVFDDFDQSGNLYRALVHYYLQSYTASSGNTGSRSRLIRDWRQCPSPTTCSLANSISAPWTNAGGDPILDWVTTFQVTPLSLKTTGTYTGIPQMVKINLTVTSFKKIDAQITPVSKTFIFGARAKNVSLIQ
jgi:prepilin-type N-terminal cleavage/methylation domain-containing protein